MNTRVTLKRFEDFDKFLEYEELIEIEGYCFYKKNYGIEKSIDLWSLDIKLAQDAIRKKNYNLSKLGLVDAFGINFYSPDTYVIDSLYHPNHTFKLGFFTSPPIKENGFNWTIWPVVGHTLSTLFSIESQTIVVYDFVKPDWIRSYHNILTSKLDFQKKAKAFDIDAQEYETAIQAFDIMAETCDYVLNRSDCEKFRFCWECR